MVQPVIFLVSLQITIRSSSKQMGSVFYFLVASYPKNHTKLTLIFESFRNPFHDRKLQFYSYQTVMSCSYAESSPKSLLLSSLAPQSPMSTFPFSLETHRLLPWDSIPSLWITSTWGHRVSISGVSCLWTTSAGGWVVIPTFSEHPTHPICMFGVRRLSWTRSHYR